MDKLNYYYYYIFSILFLPIVSGDDISIIDHYHSIWHDKH